VTWGVLSKGKKWVYKPLGRPVLCQPSGYALDSSVFVGSPFFLGVGGTFGLAEHGRADLEPQVTADLVNFGTGNIRS